LTRIILKISLYYNSTNINHKEMILLGPQIIILIEVISIILIKIQKNIHKFNYFIIYFYLIILYDIKKYTFLLYDFNILYIYSS
jgi:hypothetical protein